MLSRCVVAALTLCIVTACPAPTPAPTPTETRACVPNASLACACPDGRVGAQTCTADGAALTDCVCTPRCASDTCLGHGVCAADSSGTHCTCFPAYAGANCGSCATGASDPEGDGTCALSQCSLEQCSGRGLCDGAGGCACFAAYAGSRCETCAPSFQDHDGDGVCAPACPAAACSGHGTCSDTTGRTTCTCTPGWVGDSCEQCAAGLQDTDGDGRCEPTCASSSLSCAAPSSCVEVNGVPTCVCPAGYAADGTTLTGALRCTWAGLVKDPEITLGDGGWTVLADGGVTSIAGEFDDGALQVDPSAVNNYLLDQIVDLPASSVPWAVRGAGTTGLAVRLGTAVTRWLPDRELACVGDAVTPGRQHLSIGLTSGLTDAFGGGNIDHVELVPAPTCPRPGTVRNGSFDDTTGWTADVGQITNGRLEATFASCRGGYVTGVASFPSSGANALAVTASVNELGNPTTFHQPALQLVVESVTLNPVSVVPVGNSGPVVFCTGAWRGSASRIRLFLRNPAPCNDPSRLSFALDDVRLIDDPRCQVTDGVTDPHFAWGDAWLVSGAGGITRDQQTGNLEFRSATTCASSALAQPVLVPPANGTAGPAVDFSYRLAGPGELVVGGTSLPASGWRRWTSCLRPQASGLTSFLGFFISPTSACSDATAQWPDVAIDDVKVITSSQCPVP